MPLSQAERSRRCREKKKVAKYGESSLGVNMSGKHGNHAKGESNARWAGNRRKTQEGYVVVRVPTDHPHGWGSSRLKTFRYAYEHHVVAMEMIGRLLDANEVVHHRNGRRDDNRPQNLEITTRSDHAREHTSLPQTRDSLGRFNNEPRHDMSEWPEDSRIRQMPEVKR